MTHRETDTNKSHTLYAKSPTHGHTLTHTDALPPSSPTNTETHTGSRSPTHSHRYSSQTQKQSPPLWPPPTHAFTGTHPYQAWQALALLSHPQAARPNRARATCPPQSGRRWGLRQLLSGIPVAARILPTSPLPLKTRVRMGGAGEETPVLN